MMDTKLIELVTKDVHGSLYSKDVKAQAAVIDNWFHADAVFEDPLLYVRGASEVKMQFAALAMLFSSVVPNVKHAMSAKHIDGCIVEVEADIAYTLPAYLLYATINLRTISRFHWSERQKIVHLEDLWNLTDVIAKVPLFGCLYANVFRPSFGYISSLVISFLR